MAILAKRRRRQVSSTRASAYLAARTRFGIKFGLETIGALVEALGHPEQCYPCLLVAGTNGKGSVVAYADAALRGAGLRVGRYTSPHLVRVSERIVVDGREIGPAALAAAVEQVRRAAETLVRAGRIPAHPTYFEVLTAAAFQYFRHSAVDVALLEVGLGGRLDATNIVSPLASAIVTIDHDHEQYLGNTLAEIAREKAGVLRPGRRTVLGPLPPEALAAIGGEAERRGALLVTAAAGVEVREETAGLSVRTPAGRYAGLTALPGAHQRQNLLVALRLIEAAHAAGLAVDLARVSGARWPPVWRGRLEWVPGRPPLLLDGAHNPAGARALADYLKSIGPFVLVFGVMADKDVSEVAQRLFPLARDLVLTRAPGRRGEEPEAIAARAGASARKAVAVPHVGRALRQARALAGSDTPVVVAGSLYLVGAVLDRLSRSRKWSITSGVDHSAGPT